MMDRSETTEESPLPAAGLPELSPGGIPQISFVIPTRNEAENIAPLLSRLSEAIQDFHAEILFVDDSTDHTPIIISDLAEQYPFEIRLLVRPPLKRNGLSGAVVDGLLESKGTWVCVMDADLQHPPETVPLMWEQAQRTGADLVVSSRRGDVVGPLGLTRIRSLTSKVLTILARMLFPRTLKDVSDPLTGLFLVRRDAVDVNALRPDGFKILLEILVRCPGLHVSEIQFDFAPRYGGESKADVREGVRFFRHLLRLRVTVNPHLIRFIIVVIAGVVFNSLVLWALVNGLRLPTVWSAVVAVEFFFLWVQIGFQYWVFRDRAQEDLRRGFWSSFLVSQLFVFLIFLPLLLLFSSFGSLHYVVENLLALFVVGFIRYGLSEQWIWTKGSMIWQYQSYFYSIHGKVNIESQVPLEELQFFKKESLEQEVDIQIRLDRHGTPSRLPDGISYDEQLGRFGFGLTVLPGDFTQIVVSPLLERSPNFLFTNIVEPVIRWRLVQKEFALVKAAGVARDGIAVLMCGDDEMGKVAGDICQQMGYAFMADDLIIVGKDGRVLGYPKPVTIDREMIEGDRTSPTGRNRLILTIRRALYTRYTRRLGLWLSARELPAATLNTYLQWLVPQPKEMLGNVLKGVAYEEMARLGKIMAIRTDHDDLPTSNPMDVFVQILQQSEEANSFQPHPLLAQRLRFWQDEDLMDKEK
ncbi:MAG: glycosyltransferase family 2 protein, partial [Candidatus Promineifilaceae bacterium]|nr:glycosyltransferase family 2 protein [Candidatus Promineifilaceae bacterium]